MEDMYRVKIPGLCHHCGHTLDTALKCTNYMCPGKKKEFNIHYGTTTLPPKGWVCPVCGRGVANWIPYCDCVKQKKEE